MMQYERSDLKRTENKMGEEDTGNTGKEKKTGGWREKKTSGWGK